MELKRVVVTGLGAVTPLGNTVAETWEAMKNGVSGAGPITLFDASLFKTQFACEVKNFDPTAYLDRKEARKLDRFNQLALVASKEALQNSCLDLEKEDLERIGVIVGSGMGGLHSLEESLIEFGESETKEPRFSPFFIPKAIMSLGAGHISLAFGLKGPSYAISTACASSSHAICEALDLIRLGRADVLFTCGADADVAISGIGGFNAMHALSTRNDDPARASRPYSKSRDGFVLGEGAACLVLEEYEHAKARGAQILAEVVGGAMNSDAHHVTAPDPTGEGARKVMKLALEDAGIEPEQIDYINTHGTSTPLGDVAELKAIQNLFGEHAYKLNISSTKSMTGHLLGATGVVEALACILALRDGIIPPTINHDEDDEDENIDYRLNFTFNKAEKRNIEYALSNTFGFGGHNSALVFKKWKE